MKRSESRMYYFLLSAAVMFFTVISNVSAQCDIDIPDLGCNNIDYSNECIGCAGQTGLALVQLYIDFPDQGPLEDYGITVEYGNDTDGFQTWTDDFYSSGGTIQFVIDTTTIFYLTEVVCPNGDVDTENLGDTVTISVEATPFFDFPGAISGCDSAQLPPITGQDIPADAAYFTLPGGQGDQFAPGDWVSTGGFYYIFGQNGPCEGLTTVEVEILDCNDICNIDTLALSCSPFQLGLSDTCEYCDDDAAGVIVPIYFYFPDQAPGETYNLTIETVFSGGLVDVLNVDDYTSGAPVTISTQDSFMIYLTSVECPNGEIDLTDLGDTVHIFVTRAPTFNQLGPVVDVCDSVGLPPIEGLFVPPDAAYYSESGGNGTQYMPGDWITENGIFYIYGTNGPCTGEIAFQINIVNSGNADWTPPDFACLEGGVITLEPETDLTGAWTGPGITDNGDGTATFDPLAAGTGDAIITYTVTLSGCTSALTDTIPVAGLAVEVLSIECDDNGTPSDEVDDFYTATVVITGTNTSPSWTSDDPQNPFGNFGDTVVFTSLPTNSTNIFTISDNGTTNCSTEFSIVTGEPCGAVCDIMIEPGDAICNSNNTWFDSSDDLISQGLVISNGGAGGTFTANDPNNTTGQFGTITIFGPYDTDGQDLVITITSDDDPSCSVEWTIPHTCNADCSIEDVIIENVECNDGGTPDDPSDDYVTFSASADGADLSNGFFITSDIGAIIPTFGFYDDTTDFQTEFGSAGTTDEITITFIDFDNPECTFDAVIDNPGPCSNDVTCEIVDAGLLNVTCNDFGTPDIPDDDFIDITLNPTGTGLSGSYTVTSASVMVSPGVGTYGSDQSFQLMGAFTAPDPIIITITDSDDIGCSLDVEVPNVTPCFDECQISLDLLIEEGCDNNGTPDDPGDDTFSFQVLINGTNTGTGWTANDPSSTDGAYGFAEPFGPFLISDGTVTFMITDNENPDCQVEISVVPPLPCSAPCEITLDAGTADCNNNGTPSDPSDDLFVVDIEITGDGSGWTSTDPVNSSGAYGGSIEFGPYPIADGTVEIIFTDIDNPLCADTIQITPPSACSDECLLEVEVIEQFCDDNGTPGISSDDVHFLTVIVEGTNSGLIWQLNDQVTASGEYGLPAPIGPFNLTQQAQLVFFDSINTACDAILEIGPLPGCSAGCPSADSTFMQMTTCDPLQAGFETQFFIGSDGCDSVVVIETMLLTSDSTFVTNVTCNPADTGIVEEFFVNSNGCDSVVLNTIVLGQSDTSFISSFSCDPADTIVSTSVFQNAVGCDSVVVISIELLQADTTLLINQTCDPADTTPVVSIFQNILGCDSVVIIEPVFVENDTVLITAFSCDPADTTTNITVLNNSDGCDSIIIEQVILSPSDSIMIQNTSCAPADTGVLINTFTNSNGCDSVVVTTTILVDADSSTITLVSCNPMDTGTFVQTLPGQSGCDSVIITNVALSFSDTTSLISTSCNPQDTGLNVEILTSQFGCDSIIITTTLFQESDSTYLSASSCNPLDTGILIEILQSQVGCDSVIITNTMLIESDTTMIMELLCPGEAIEINGEVYDSSNTSGLAVLSNRNGCDSLVMVEVSISQPAVLREIDTIFCPGESLVVNGMLYDELMPSGTEVIQSIQTGCDSIIIEIDIQYDGPDLQLVTTDAPCPGQTGQIEIVSVSNLSTPSRLILNSDSIIIVNSVPFVLDDLDPGIYSIQIEDSSNCQAATTAVISEGDDLVIEVDSVIIVSGPEQQITPILNFDVETVIWSPAEFVDCADCLSPSIEIDGDAQLTVQAFDENGCSAIATIQLLYQRDFEVFAPNVFTPNNDGVNDRFTIYTSDDNNATLVELAVFDRWGGKVFEARNITPGAPSSGWDGTHKGKVLDPGVFVFNAVIESNGTTTDVISGDVTLIR